MEVKEISYTEAKRYIDQAERDRVGIYDTQHTKWYAIAKDDEDVVGVAGLMFLSSTAARIKGIWVRPPDRGHGYGTFLTLFLIEEAKKLGIKRLEAHVYNPSFYIERGWYKTGNPWRNGAQRVETIL